MSNIRRRLQFASWHLSIGLAVGVIAAGIVLRLWYPRPYTDASTGIRFFLIVVAVNVLLGPVLAFMVQRQKKSKTELLVDLIVVVMVQIAALGYGLFMAMTARPVHLVFEYDRFRLVYAGEVPSGLLKKTPDGIKALPLDGPTILSLRPFVDNNEEFNATLAALNGISLSARPDLWRAYVDARPEVLKAAKSLIELKKRFPDRVKEIDRVEEKYKNISSFSYVPMVAVESFWTVVIDAKTLEVVEFLPIDSF